MYCHNIAASTEGAGLLQVRGHNFRIANYRGSRELGQRVNIQIEVGREGGNISSSNVPRVVWLVDGKPLLFLNPQTSVVGNHLLVTLTFAYAPTTDEGIYQCILIDPELHGGEYLFTHPVRLSNGKSGKTVV